MIFTTRQNSGQEDCANSGVGQSTDEELNSVMAVDSSSVENNDEAVNLQSEKTEYNISPAPQWKYLPIPEDPDKHDEFYSRCLDTPDGFKLIGARVRGRKHKHEGTNCDDWFHVAVSGKWTIIAVSDGAGSRKFSRVGSEAACTAAVEHLSACLAGHEITYRETWTDDTFRRDDTGVGFAEEDLETIRKALHQSMLLAYESMEKAAAERSERKEYSEILGRQIKTDDLSSTLLLAVHTTVQVQHCEKSLIFTCAVGDGMIAAIDKNGAAHLLMTPDSGQYSGEVTFLSRKEVQPEKLVSRTFPFLGTIRALVAMTDGVADDYFPNDSGMSLLYGDLILNQIIPLVDIDESAIAKALSKTGLPAITDIQKAGFCKPVERITESGTVKVMISSMETFSEEIGVSVEDVLASPALLAAGRNVEKMVDDEISPEEKLQVWLDSYHVRGSFDDRTLAVMFREGF